MFNSIDEYLADLRKRLSKQLSQSETEDHITEARQHLESAAAENGAGIEGEYQATKAFGASEKVATQMIQAHSLRRPWVTAGAIASLVGVPTTLMGAALIYERNFEVVFAILIGLALVFVGFSVKGRKVLTRQIAIAWAVTLIALPLASCIFFVTIYPEAAHGLIPRFQAQQFIAQNQRNMDQLRPIFAQINAAENAYGLGDNSYLPKLRVAGGYLVPIKLDEKESSAFGTNYSLETRVAPTLQGAQKLWEQHRSVAQAGDSRAQFTIDAAAIRDELKEPILKEYGPFFADTSVWLSIYFLIMFVVNYFCVNIANGVRRVWRRRQLST